ncbi:MAG: hypothetical protein GEU88_19280 [Solirubrobacterales bacterium]|nr:hypothetical protein [Solirubrobacterales bacterium]
MTFLGRRIAWILVVPLLVGVVGATGWYLLSGRAAQEFAAPLRSGAEDGRSADAPNDTERAKRDGRARGGEGAPGASQRDRDTAGGPPDAAVGKPAEDTGAVASQAWRVVRSILLGLALAGLSVLIARTVSRRRRRYRRYVVRIGRVDGAPPLQVARMMAAIWAVLSRRAHERLLGGQPAVSFEVHNIVGRNERQQLLMVVLPDGEEIVGAVQGALRARWRESYLSPYIDEDSHAAVPEPWWCERIVRLKKQHRFAPRTLHIPRADEWRESGALIDSVLETMRSLDQTATLQITLSPTPRLFESAARALIREREEALERDRQRGGSPGLQSEVAEAELEGGAQGLAFEALFFGELRVGARQLAVARRIADTVAGNSRSRGQNQLVERQIIRHSPRQRIYEWRMRHGQPNPLPSWWKNVFSAAEVAGLWQLPAIGAHSTVLERHYQPRAGAPPAIEVCDRAVALASDADRRGVAIAADDLYLNHLILGVHGSGKTSLLLRQFERMAADYGRAVILADPKGDAAKRAVGPGAR